MKKICVSILIFLTAQSVLAQGQGQYGHMRFSPEDFRQHQHEFIAQQAQLTEEEQEVFFPVFDEMKEKERALFAKQRQKKQRPQTDEEFKEAISNYDKMDIELKKLQQTYHQKFLKILSPKKVFKIIRAEDLFRTQMFRTMAKRRHNHEGMNKKNKKE